MKNLMPDHPKTYPKTAVQQLTQKYHRTFSKDLLERTQKNFPHSSVEFSLGGYDSPEMNPIIHVENMDVKQLEKTVRKNEQTAH